MENEFAALFDIALTKGIKHAEIIKDIERAVKVEYKKRYPKNKAEFNFIIDTKTGLVRLLTGTNDITPPDFITIASQIARGVIIKKIQKAENGQLYRISRSTSIPPVVPNRPDIHKWVIILLFWSYNGLYLFFLAFSLIGLINSEFRTYISDFLQSYGLYRGLLFFILLVTPLSAVLISVRTKLYQSAQQLAKLFFLLEIPLVMISFIMLISFGQVTPIVQLFSIIILAIPVIFYIHLIDIGPLEKIQKMLYLFLIEIVLLTSTYICLLLSFYLPLLLGGLVSWIIGGLFYSYGRDGIRGMIRPYSLYENIGMIIVLFLGLIGFALVAFLLILPFIVVFVFGKMFWDARKDLSADIRLRSINISIIVVAAVYFSLVMALSYQPATNPYIPKLEEIISLDTFKQREEIAKDLIPHENQIKQFINDMYNARSRYLFTKDDRFLAEGYKQIFKLDAQTSQFIQDAFLTLAYPFVYQLNIDNNQSAIKGYQYLFGYSPLSNYDRYKTVDVKEVKLARRITNASYDYYGLLGKISIEDEYTTTSFRSQEVIYEFSLPNDAVITDLRLGPHLEYKGTIAPKGAARKTYEKEVNKSRDPALLEQTGPRQYRLRVFPIPGKNDNSLNGLNQRVQFSYVVAATADGFPLPSYTKIQNVLVDGSTIKSYILEGKSIQVGDEENFIKDPLTKGSLVNLCDFVDMVPTSTSYASVSAYIVPHLSKSVVRDQAVCNKNSGLWLPNMMKNLNIAVLFDISIDNKKSTLPEQLRQFLLYDQRLIENNKIDLFYFNDHLSSPNIVTQRSVQKPFDITYFGESDLVKVLNSLKQKYDFAIFVMGGKNTLLSDVDNFLLPEYPVYFIHPNKSIPPYNSTLTNMVIASRGKIVDSFQEAFNHFILTKQLHQWDKTLAYLFVGPYWSIGARIKKDMLPPDRIPDDLYYQDAELEIFSDKKFVSYKDFPVSVGDPLTYEVSRAFLYETVSKHRSEILNKYIPLLDDLNNFARVSNMVTPYSSLIALVNEQQITNLNQQAQNYDRYDDTLANNVTDIRIMPPANLRITSPMMFSLPSAGMELSSGKTAPIGLMVINPFSGIIFGIGGLFILLNGILVGIGILILLFTKVKKFLIRKR